MVHFLLILMRDIVWMNFGSVTCQNCGEISFANLGLEPKLYDSWVPGICFDIREIDNIYGK